MHGYSLPKASSTPLPPPRTVSFLTARQLATQFQIPFKNLLPWTIPGTNGFSYASQRNTLRWRFPCRTFTGQCIQGQYLQRRKRKRIPCQGKLNYDVVAIKALGNPMEHSGAGEAFSVVLTKARLQRGYPCRGAVWPWAMLLPSAKGPCQRGTYMRDLKGQHPGRLSPGGEGWLHTNGYIWSC